MAKTGQPRQPRRDKQTGGKPAILESGTALAVNNNLESCDGTSPKRGWGGARNKAGRTSQFLNLRQCQGIIASADHAERIGLHFNRHWTIHYERAGIAEHEATRFIGRLLKLTGDCARRHKGKVAAMWVRENGDGKGGHVHILLHFPAGLSLVGRTRRWIRLAGGDCRKQVSRCRPIGGRVMAAETGGGHYLHNVGMVRNYLLKGADIAAGESLGLPHCGKGGIVVGKRCGSTQNIGRAAASNSTAQVLTG